MNTWCYSADYYITVVDRAEVKEKETVGERIDIFEVTPFEFSAREPFHIAHGWGPPILFTDELHPPYGLGLLEFKLEVGGVYHEEDFKEHFRQNH